MCIAGEELGCQLVCVKEKAETGGDGEETESPICRHCHGYCRNDLAGGRP